MPTNPPARPLGRFVLVLVTSILFGACASGSAPVPDSSPASVPPAFANDLPLRPSTGPSNRAGGGAPGDPGSGVGAGGGPVGGAIDPAPVDPGAGQAALVLPQPGRLNPRPSAPQWLQASVDGRRVLVKVIWYGGIEPCSVLDSVKVVRNDRTISITILEGSSDPNAACIDIAKLKATIVDLGELDAGRWTVNAPDGSAAPITVTVA
jgi:hypothetical protein